MLFVMLGLLSHVYLCDGGAEAALAERVEQAYERCTHFSGFLTFEDFLSINGEETTAEGCLNFEMQDALNFEIELWVEDEWLWSMRGYGRGSYGFLEETSKDHGSSFRPATTCEQGRSAELLNNGCSIGIFLYSWIGGGEYSTVPAGVAKRIAAGTIIGEEVIDGHHCQGVRFLSEFEDEEESSVFDRTFWIDDDFFIRRIETHKEATYVEGGDWAVEHKIVQLYF